MAQAVFTGFFGLAAIFAGVLFVWRSRNAGVETDPSDDLHVVP